MTLQFVLPKIWIPKIAHLLWLPPYSSAASTNQGFRQVPRHFAKLPTHTCSHDLRDFPQKCMVIRIITSFWKLTKIKLLFLSADFSWINLPSSIMQSGHLTSFKSTCLLILLACGVSMAWAGAIPKKIHKNHHNLDTRAAINTASNTPGQPDTRNSTAWLCNYPITTETTHGTWRDNDTRVNIRR